MIDKFGDATWGWQMVSAPAGLKVWVVLPDDDAEPGYRAALYDALMLAGYAVTHTRSVDQAPTLVSEPAGPQFMPVMDKVPVPVATAVLTGAGWFLLGATVFLNEGDAIDMAEEFGAMEAAADEMPPGSDQTH